MRITILNGETDPKTTFEASVSQVAERLSAAGHEVSLLRLRELELRGCSGCFGCWVKTPGECVKRDDSAIVRRAALDADLLLLASPMVMGFTTALLKRAADQMIALVHPFFAVEHGEVHHRARYAKYPKFGLLLGAEAGCDSEDIDIATAMWGRMARNLKSKLVVTSVLNPMADRTAEEVANELALVA